MKVVLLLHDNARPHTSLRTRKAIARVRWTVLAHPVHSSDLAPSYCKLFGPVRDALRGRHFADDNKLKQSFRDVLRSRSRKFYNTGIQRLAQRLQKCVDNYENFCGKNSLMIANIQIVCVNFAVTAITFSKKDWRHYFRSAPRNPICNAPWICVTVHPSDHK
jgi:hypothetical protein